jgi:pimeloyl-ACP methyl ester carboxylesterase
LNKRLLSEIQLAATAKGTTIRIGDVDLYYEMHGSGDPLICLHNFSSNGRTRFYPLLPILTERFTCYLVDLRGHGQSNNPSSVWSHEQSSRDIIGLVEALGLGSCRFLATSSGGMTMLRVARYAPKLVNAMILDSATYRVPLEARNFYKSPDKLSEKLVEYYRAANEIYGPDYWRFLAQTFYDFRLPECDINVPLETLREIQAPTLIISGDRDSFFTVDIAIDMKLTIPNSELLVVPNTKHIVMAFFPEMVAKRAIDFFDRHA